MDLQDETLLTGDHHGHLRLHSTNPVISPVASFQATCANLTNVLFYGPDKVITAQGQRSFHQYNRRVVHHISDSDTDSDTQPLPSDVDIKLFRRPL